MAKGMYHYLQQAWMNPDSDTLKSRLIEWRRSEAVAVLDKPLRLDKARMLGYKDKKGIIVVRVRVKRGGRKRVRVGVKGRKSRKQTVRKTLKMNYRWISEIRAARKYPTLEVLNSYWVGKDGKNYYFEVILVDKSKPEIKSDRTLGWISSGTHQRRAERGLTSAGRKARGLRSKSHSMKVRPSLRSWNRRGK